VSLVRRERTYIPPARAEVLIRYDRHSSVPLVFAFETFRLIVRRPRRAVDDCLASVQEKCMTEVILNFLYLKHYGLIRRQASSIQLVAGQECYFWRSLDGYSG